jgi:hypothetical protein
MALVAPVSSRSTTSAALQMPIDVPRRRKPKSLSKEALASTAVAPSTASPGSMSLVPGQLGMVIHSSVSHDQLLLQLRAQIDVLDRQIETATCSSTTSAGVGGSGERLTINQCRDLDNARQRCVQQLAIVERSMADRRQLVVSKVADDSTTVAAVKSEPDIVVKSESKLPYLAACVDADQQQQQQQEPPHRVVQVKLEPTAEPPTTFRFGGLMDKSQLGLAGAKAGVLADDDGIALPPSTDEFAADDTDHNDDGHDNKQLALSEVEAKAKESSETSGRSLALSASFLLLSQFDSVVPPQLSMKKQKKALRMQDSFEVSGPYVGQPTYFDQWMEQASAAGALVPRVFVENGICVSCSERMIVDEERATMICEKCGDTDKHNETSLPDMAPGGLAQSSHQRRSAAWTAHHQSIRGANALSSGVGASGTGGQQGAGAVVAGTAATAVTSRSRAPTIIPIELPAHTVVLSKEERALEFLGPSAIAAAAEAAEIQAEAAVAALVAVSRKKSTVRVKVERKSSSKDDSAATSTTAPTNVGVGTETALAAAAPKRKRAAPKRKPQKPKSLTKSISAAAEAATTTAAASAGVGGIVGASSSSPKKSRKRKLEPEPESGRPGAPADGSSLSNEAGPRRKRARTDATDEGKDSKVDVEAGNSIERFRKFDNLLALFQPHAHHELAPELLQRLRLEALRVNATRFNVTQIRDIILSSFEAPPQPAGKQSARPTVIVPMTLVRQLYEELHGVRLPSLKDVEVAFVQFCFHHVKRYLASNTSFYLSNKFCLVNILEMMGKTDAAACYEIERVGQAYLEQCTIWESACEYVKLQIQQQQPPQQA